ncbi:hypothetical protein D9613_005781 [Agrocybe pediades]|uniref:Heterokaryon incompatibility domain-containing protein n=1 Tax=Agrocybe pediades TaxID=84607 RepID=A0A8H4QUW4_9AGAR|nr:hypothetical protein D9613_005781 [Agrocybe pediades]
MIRLINTKTITIEDFWHKVPAYAILSHTWGDEEVTFQEMKSRENHPQSRSSIEKKKGFMKIKRTCEQALSSGIPYAWVDTCCIDKTSSSELSEAINSMFQYYRNAEVCYAYLADVLAEGDAEEISSQFIKARWFTRGWTLQELVAPLNVIFYDKNWVEFGTKSSLRKLITQVTNIGKQVLLANHGGEISISARMAWAANRETTRIEDMAYCLLGIFGINMPILYGEGPEAFVRLQKEIIATSDDHTIFAWMGGPADGSSGLLAASPHNFYNSAQLSNRKAERTSPYSLTNVGLSITLPLQQVKGTPNLYKALLNCTNDNGYLYGIYLSQKNHLQYVRVRPGDMIIESPQNAQAHYKKESIFIQEPVPSRFAVEQWMRPRSNYKFFVRKLPEGFKAEQFHPNNSWSTIPAVQGILAKDKAQSKSHCLTLGHSGISGGILFVGQGQRFVVMFGMHNYNVWSDIVVDISPSETLQTVAESYYKDHARSSMLWENRDRLCKKLTTGNKYVEVAASRGIITSDFQFIVDINVTATPPANVAEVDAVMPNAAYQFHVKYDPITWELVQNPTFDGISWFQRKDQSLTLALSHSGISGIMILRHRATKKQAAVLLGVHNYQPWSDIIPNIEDSEGVAKDLRNSYYRDGPGSRGNRLWAWDKDITVPLADYVRMRVATSVAGENFNTNIVQI